MCLACIAGLLGVSALSLILVRHRARHADRLRRLPRDLACVVRGLPAVHRPSRPSEMVLPLGLPWLGAHFRLDPLAAAFLAIINFGAASASLYALGYGRHEAEPARVLPFYPAFLAAMNLVVVAADAYSFLFAWELMSLASWALVMARHRAAKTAHAGFVYLIMASFGTFALLFAFGLLAGPHGDYAFDAIRAHHLRPAWPGLRLSWRSSAPARRRAWCRCTSGCRSRTRPRRATSRR